MNNSDPKSGFGDGIDILKPSTPAPKTPAVQQPETERPPTPKKRSNPKTEPKHSSLARKPRLKTRPTNVYLTDGQIEALERLSQQTDRSRTDLVRQAIAEFLKRH